MGNILILLALLGVIGWVWVSSMRVRESAMDICRKGCRSHGVQFLDETVTLSSLGLRRAPGGRLSLRRVYSFDYSIDGRDRYSGSASFTGDSLDALYLPETPGKTA